MTDSFRPNDAQRRAIEFKMGIPLKIVAGAGTGKTEVLTRRFVYLVEEYHLRPHRIMALTFTKKAAAEMKGRITRALIEGHLIRKSEVALLSWIGNFHSVCLKLLKQSPLVAGLDPSFSAVEDAEQRIIFAEVIEDFLNKKLGFSRGSNNFEDLMVERIEDFSENMLSIVNRLKGRFMTPESFYDSVESTLEAQYQALEKSLKRIYGEKTRADSRNKIGRQLESLSRTKAHERLLRDAVYEIYVNYNRRLEARDLLDFNDLIYIAYRLVKADQTIKKGFDYILVDEFQDTDHGQYRLLEALSDDFKDLTIVGDKKQSIYEWREARIENIDDFPGEVITLDENYRSYGEILDSANQFIRSAMPGEQPLRPASAGGRGYADAPKVSLFRAESREAEGEFIACEIRRLIEADNYKPGDAAILMRSVHSSKPYEDALSSYRIPYTTVGSCGFYDLSETKDLVALLKLVSNPFDDLSMARVLQSPIVGLNDATLYSICRHISEIKSSIYEVLKNCGDLINSFGSKTQEKLLRLMGLIDDCANAKSSLTIGELLSELLKRSEYLKYLASVEGVRGRRFSNVARLYKIAASLGERRPGARLEDFLLYIETAITGDMGSAPGDLRSDVLQIMTVHQAKGLEFPVVFVANLGPGSFPLKFRSNSFGYTEKFGLFIRKLPSGEDSVRYKGADGIGIKEHLRDVRYLEENRIMYVAMTRARDLLYLSTSFTDKKKPNDFFQFLERTARGGSIQGMTIIDSQDAVASVSVPEEMGEKEQSAADLQVEEIKEIAAKAVERISDFASPAKGPSMDATVTLSYSRLALFRHCPMKYALRYVYDLPLSPHEESYDEKHPTDGVSSFVLGNLLHKTLMLYHRTRKTGKKVDALRIFSELAESLNCSRQTLKAGEMMLENYLASPLSRIETLREESEFHWRLSDGRLRIMFEGKIDRITVATLVWLSGVIVPPLPTTAVFW